MGARSVPINMGLLLAPAFGHDGAAGGAIGATQTGVGQGVVATLVVGLRAFG